MSKSYHARISASGTPADRPAEATSTPEREAMEERLLHVVRERAQGYLRLPNVTSVGVGHRMRDGKPTDELAIQFTVARKLSQPELLAEGLTALPSEIVASDGTRVPVDVVQRSYAPSYRLIDDAVAKPTITPEEEHDQRRERLKTMVPGISISNAALSAGTLGAIVYDRATGKPYILSNWHVLHGPGGQIGDAVVQPGPYDDPDFQRNVVGRLERAHLGLAGDCAVASIEGRAFSPEILGLSATPSRAARVSLGDRVVKSGRTTGVTRGVVARVGVTVNIDYGGGVGVQQIGGFEIRPDPNGPPLPDGEISKPGDSGSAWMIDGNEKDIIVGLHFAGENDPDPAEEHALACNIYSVLEKLDITLTNPEADPSRHVERLQALSAHVAMLTERLSTMNGSCAACACHGAETSSNVSAGAEGLPIYGNWCGPGYGSGEPVDDLDRACMEHDHCYDRRGWGDCSCNRELQAAIDEALRNGHVNPLGRLVGPAMRRWFQWQPCRDGRANGESFRPAPAPSSGLRPSLHRAPPQRAVAVTPQRAGG